MEKKICDADKNYLILVGILKKADFNAKITEIESKKPRKITGLATTAALTALEDKIPNFSNLIKKTDYDVKYHTLKINIQLQLITTNLLKILLLIRCKVLD